MPKSEGVSDYSLSAAQPVPLGWFCGTLLLCQLQWSPLSFTPGQARIGLAEEAADNANGLVVGVRMDFFQHIKDLKTPFDLNKTQNTK